jgi:hypothetical protein
MKRCPTCGDVETVRFENIGHCKDSWHCSHVWNQGICKHCGLFKRTKKATANLEQTPAIQAGQECPPSSMGVCDLVSTPHRRDHCGEAWRPLTAQKALERELIAKFSDLAVEMEKHSNDHIHDVIPDNICAAVEGVCADRINAILKPYRGNE